MGKHKFPKKKPAAVTISKSSNPTSLLKSATLNSANQSAQSPLRDALKEHLAFRSQSSAPSTPQSATSFREDNTYYRWSPQKLADKIAAMKITLEIGQGLLKTSSSSKTAESYLRPAFQHAQQLDCWPLLALAMDLDCEMEYRIGLKEVAVNLQKDAFALRRKNMPKGMDPQWVVDQYRWLDVIRRVENIREKIIKDTKNTRIKLQHADDSFEENTEDNTDKPRDNEPLGWATWVVEPYNFFARSVYPTEIVEDDTSKRSPTRSDAGNDMVLGSPKSLVDITGDILADILDREDFRSPAQSPSSPGAADHSPM